MNPKSKGDTAATLTIKPSNINNEEKVKLSQFLHSLNGQPFNIKSSALLWVHPHTLEGRILYRWGKNGTIVVEGMVAFSTLADECFQRGINCARREIEVGLGMSNRLWTSQDVLDLVSSFREKEKRADIMSGKKISKKRKKVYDGLKTIKEKSRKKDGVELSLLNVVRMYDSRHGKKMSEREMKALAEAWRKFNNKGLVRRKPTLAKVRKK